MSWLDKATLCDQIDALTCNTSVILGHPVLQSVSKKSVPKSFAKKPLRKESIRKSRWGSRKSAQPGEDTSVPGPGNTNLSHRMSK